jgi:hypothetical protein
MHDDTQIEHAANEFTKENMIANDEKLNTISHKDKTNLHQ